MSDADFRNRDQDVRQQDHERRVHREPGAGWVRGLSNSAVPLPEGVWTRRAEHDEPVGGRRSSSGGAASPTGQPRSRPVRGPVRVGLAARRAAGAAPGRRATERSRRRRRGSAWAATIPRCASATWKWCSGPGSKPPFARSSPVEEGVDADWRRRRVQVEGSYKRLEYEVSHEFGDPQEPERDAYVNMRFSRPFELQAGRFKMPFGRDALASGANIDFVHRSLLGRQLAPGRDLGVMAHGRLSDAPHLRCRLLSPRRRQRAVARLPAADARRWRAGWRCSRSSPARTARSSRWKWGSPW